MSHRTISPRQVMLEHKYHDAIHDLKGLEQASLLTNMSKYNNYKPLPATPSLGKRISISPPRKASALRRSSSLYSRSASTWYPEIPIIPDLQEHPLPIVNPTIYRNSGVATLSEPQLLLPRTYSPLLATPSNTSSEIDLTQIMPREQRPSALLPPPISHPALLGKKLNTVTLAAAQAVNNAPKAEHLLPEEFRARMIRKARSTSADNGITGQFTDKPAPPGSALKVHDTSTIRLPSMMMFDAETWHNFNPAPQRPPLDTTSHWSGSTAIAWSGEQSNSTSANTSTTDLSEPIRGRTMHRMPRNLPRYHDLQGPSDARLMAEEYSALLGSPYELSPFDQVKPLAINKTSERNQSSDISPGRTRVNSQDETWDTDDTENDPPPPAKFFQPQYAFPESDSEDNKIQSRTGSIPISPPPTISSLPPVSEPKPERLMKARQKARESAYYPYVGKRRPGKYSKSSKAIKTPMGLGIESMAVSAARTAAKTTNSPEARAPTKTSGEVSRLINKVAQKAVKVADKLSKPQQPPSPADLSQSVTAVYLCLGEESKEDFDASKPVSPKLHYATGIYSPRAVVKQTYTHVVTAARPLDERAYSVSDASQSRPGHSRKNSILGGLLELTREKGREKRREEIKRTIKLIPNASSQTRPVLEAKSASEADVPSATPTMPIHPGIWGRRISEFGSGRTS